MLGERAETDSTTRRNGHGAVPGKYLTDVCGTSLATANTTLASAVGHHVSIFEG
jgi:hypothetical protein